MIARNHDRRDRGRHAVRKRLRHFRARRIDESDKTNRVQIGFDGAGFKHRGRPVEFAARDGQHTIALAREFVGQFQQFLRPGAPLEYALRRTLDVDDRPPVAGVNRAHELAITVERKLTDPWSTVMPS